MTGLLEQKPSPNAFVRLVASFLPLCLLAAIAATTACSKGGLSSSGSTGGTPPASVAVSISPASANVVLGDAQQLNATVTGSSNTAVDWSVNGVAGGNSTVGTVTSAGLYTAPADLPSPANVTLTATSQASSTATASSTVTVTSDVRVTVQSSASSVQPGGTIQLTATVSSSGHPDLSVTWLADSVAGGNSTVGTIQSTGTDAATYTAPSIAPNPASVNIEAKSVADASQSATSALTVAVPTSLMVDGIVAISPVQSSSITAYALNPDGSLGAALGTAVSGSDGTFALKLNPPPSTPFLIDASGGSYYDEVTGAYVLLNGVGDLTAAILPGAANVAVTPFTHMAATRARTLAGAGVPLAIAVSTSDLGIEQQYQVADILGTFPVAANNTTAIQAATTDQRGYGLALAGLMQEAQTLGVQGINLAEALAADASDGMLDGLKAGSPISVQRQYGGAILLPAKAGTADLQTGINSLIASASNKTSLTAKSILVTPVPLGVNTTFSNPFYPKTTVLPAWIEGKAGSVTLGATGGVSPYKCALANGSSLPSGFALSSTCVLSGTGPVLPAGTPMEILPGPFTVVFSDSSQPPNTAQFSYYITVIEPPPVINVLNGDCSAGAACSVQIATASGGTGPGTYYFTDDTDLGLPPVGMIIDTNGVLSGTAPATPGTYSFGVCVVDAFGSEDCNTASVTVTQAVAQYTLTVGAAGTGSGSVASTPAGITCPGTCAANFASGTNVTLTATPATGSTFTSWGGACSGAGGCAVAMTQNQNVTATFDTTGGGGTETWTGTITGTATDSATGGVTSACYAAGATGTWSFSYQVTITVVSSLASAVQTNGAQTSGTGAVSGSESVTTQLPSNPPDNCQLLASSVSSGSLLVDAFGPTSSLPPQIQLEGPSGSSDCTSDATFGNSCALWYYALQPTAVSSTQISGVLASGGGYQGTFTLTKH